MRICFINPAIIKIKNPKTWNFEPLAPSVLKPYLDDNEFYFYDDRIEEIDFNKRFDLVMITANTLSIKRAYKISEIFRQRGLKTIMGGFHPSLNPQEAIKYCDAVCIGEGEMIIQDIVDDFKKGKLKRFYKNKNVFDLKYLKTDRSVFNGKKYIPVSLIEATRGCRFNCEFCAVKKFFGGIHRTRPIKNIIEEIKNIKNKYIMFVDDNLTFNKTFAKNLFRELISLKKIWFSQVSIDFAFDDEMIDLAYKSGCRGVLMGIESLDKNNLKIMRKDWMEKLGGLDYAIRKVHKKGINIYASFISGYDFDTKHTIHKILKYSVHNAFFLVGFNPLLPMPGTDIYKRYLKREDFDKKWWLNPDYRFGLIPFKHSNFDDINEFINMERKKFYSFPSIFSRFLRIISERRKNPFLFLILNILAYKEIREKFGMRTG